MPSTSSPEPTSALPASTKDKEQVPPTMTRKRSDSKNLTDDIEKLMAAKAMEDPLHVTKKDAARIESVEHKALGHRPPSGSVAAQVQAMADKVENFHKIADEIEEKLRVSPSSVTKEDAQHVLSKEHKVLGHYPPKDSISAAAQRVAAANEREAKKSDADEKDEGAQNDGAKSTTASDATENVAPRRMSSVDKAKADQFKAKALDVVIREAKDAFQKELEEEFSKTGEAKSVDKESANKAMAEKTEAVESAKANAEGVSAVPANGHVKEAE
ncbi:uncharacterized protein J3D65DRAFT_665332 [Phyllosticta citribraziliensis]|uniref:SMP domain-containing protein n=1 Tax=Phyllosticta citribraziliensis TaxID=989973 RepID=A0ABR1LZG8_9PEZI